MILGHEVAGEIVEVGAEVDPGRSGERVALLAYKGCGVCRYCRRGQENLCEDTLHLGHGAGWEDRAFYPGGMATYCPIWSEMAYTLPAGIPYDEATQLDGLGVAVRAVHRAELQPMDRVAVLGAGPIGLLILQVAGAYGARRVVCTEVSPRSMDIARQCGADAVIDARSGDVVARIRKEFGGVGPDVVFDTVGAEETLRDGLATLARGGRMVALAIKPERLTLEGGDLSGERSIATTANSPYPDFQHAIDLLASGKVQVTPMITHHFPLSQGLEAFAAGLDRERTGAVKVIICPGEEEADA
jgi:threonine dehydrogenase-like Zn-dependent dehydrogenase